MKSFIAIIICFLGIIILFGTCANNNQQAAVNATVQLNEDSVSCESEPSIRQISTFIKNTIYRTEEFEVYPIEDLRYTPTKIIFDGPVYVKINGNTAEVSVGNSYSSNHNILSSQCYEVNGEKVANLRTGNGDIQIILNAYSNRPKIRFFIKTDTHRIGLSGYNLEE